MISIDLVSKYISVFLSIVALVGVAWNWIRSGSDKNAKEIAEQQRELDATKSDVRDLKSRVDAMPGTQALHQIELAISEIGGDLKKINAQMQGHSEILRRVEAQVQRHDQHLLSKGN